DAVASASSQGSMSSGSKLARLSPRSFATRHPISRAVVWFSGKSTSRSLPSQALATSVLAPEFTRWSTSARCSSSSALTAAAVSRRRAGRSCSGVASARTTSVLRDDARRPQRGEHRVDRGAGLRVDGGAAGGVGNRGTVRRCRGVLVPVPGFGHGLLLRSSVGGVLRGRGGGRGFLRAGGGCGLCLLGGCLLLGCRRRLVRLGAGVALPPLGEDVGDLVGLAGAARADQAVVGVAVRTLVVGVDLAALGAHQLSFPPDTVGQHRAAPRRPVLRR